MSRKFLTRRQVAERYNWSVRTVERRQRDDPDFARSTIMMGRHYFDIDHLEAYDKLRAAQPQQRRPSGASARPAAPQQDGAA